MATDQYRTLHQFYTHEDTHTSGQHSGNGPEKHNKSTTPKLPQHEKQLRLSTMASTLGTHKTTDYIFHFWGMNNIRRPHKGN
jgi:hypothetical protein